MLNVKNGTHWVAVDEAKTLSTGKVYIMDSLSSDENADITLDSRYPTFQIAQSYKGGSTPSTYISKCTYYPSYLTVRTPEASKLWSTPCSDATSDEAVNIGKTNAGDPLTVTAMYKNTQGNFWYKVTYNGKECYIYGANTTFVGALYGDVTISDSVPPSDLTVGSTYVISGTIASKYNTINKVIGTISNTEKIWINCEDEINSRNYSLRGSKIDMGLTFNTLPAGLYCYDINAYVKNYYTSDGKTETYKTNYINLESAWFNVISKSEHVCSFDTYVYNEAEHPHYKCYQCSTCQNVSRDTSQPTQNNTCDQCRPGKGVLNVNLNFSGIATFTWTSTANTTHYNVWLDKKNADGKWESIEQVFYAESGFRRTLTAGEYRAQLLTYNSNMWEPDGSDWVHTWADDVFFTVSDGTYTISYNANGGSGAPSNQTESVGTYINLSWTIPTRFGYSFQGWSTDSSASSVVYWPGDVFTDDTSVTLYAVWREAEVLSGDTVGQFSEIAYINCPNAGVYFAFIPNTSTEYRIMSESDEDVCVDLFDANGNLIASDDDSGDGTNFLLTFNFTANETYYIYVRYYSSSLVGTFDFNVSKSYYVAYDANGGTGAPGMQYHFFNEPVTLSTAEPTRPGYIFMGWSTSNSASDPQYLPGYVYSGNHNLTLYAVWGTELNIIDSGICGIDLTWKFTSDGCLTISGTGAMFDFEEFESPWTDYYLRIKRVVIEQGATSIGEFAFKSCLYLTRVQIPNSVSSIGALAFESCDSLQELVLPSGLTSIGVMAFGWCSSLSSITIPANVSLIEDSAFSCCDSLKQITFRGNAPIFEEDVFFHVTAEAYYPNDNSTWAADTMLDYGGAITWIPYQAMSFTDVKYSDYYYEPVLWAVDEGITDGVTETEFAPEDTCKRSQVVTFLWRAAGEPKAASRNNPFVDVKSSDYFYEAVLWAVEKGITDGMDETHFEPNGVCNRSQVVTFLYRAFGEPPVGSTSNPFTDVPANKWYATPVLWAVKEGITDGVTETSFAPEKPCTRGQVVTFLYRAYN